MSTMIKSAEPGLERTEKLADGKWIHLENPSAEDIAGLHQESGIPIDLITAALDIHERPRKGRDADILLIVVRVPHFQGPRKDVPYVTVAFGIVLAERVIATVCLYRTPFVKDLRSGEARGLRATKRIRFVLQLLMAVSRDYLNALSSINDSVDSLEDKLRHSLRNREVLELLNYQKSLTHFMTALQSNYLVLERLQKNRIFHPHENGEDVLEDVMTEMTQAIEMTRIADNILSQMMDAFASIISNNLNIVMKFMAAITIILALPALVASIYGMNLELPLAERRDAFLIVMGVALVASLITLFVFWRKDWL